MAMHFGPEFQGKGLSKRQRARGEDIRQVVKHSVCYPRAIINSRRSAKLIPRLMSLGYLRTIAMTIWSNRRTGTEGPFLFFFFSHWLIYHLINA